MSALHSHDSVASGTIFNRHRCCVLPRRWPSSCRLARNSAASISRPAQQVQKLRQTQMFACGRKTNAQHTAFQTRCQASAAPVADFVETVEVKNSDMLHFSPSADGSSGSSLVSNTLEIQRISDKLLRQINELTEYTREDKERIQEAVQDRRLATKQAKAARRSRSVETGRDADDTPTDRQQSHSQASTSSPVVALTREKPHPNSSAYRTSKASKTKAKSSLKTAAPTADSAPNVLSSRAKSRASNRSGRHAAWGTHTEASSTGLSVDGKPANPAMLEAGLGTALGGLVKRSTQLLTAAEEYQLTTHVKDLLKCDQVREDLAAELGRSPTNREWAAAVDEPSEQAFLDRMQLNRAAKRQMINCNQRLVMSIARKYLGRGVDLPDLVAEGITGLIKGVDRFDHTRGFKFSTYAHWWIRQSINRAICEQGRVVRLPVHLHEVLMKVRKAEKELGDTLLRDPTQEEVAEKAGITEAKLHNLHKVHKNPASLEAPAGPHNDNDSSLADFIHDESDVTPDEAAVHKMLTQDMNNLLYTLSERESEVLRLRYGLDDGKEKTLEEVGRVMLVTRERIRQIEYKALRKLKDPQRCSVLAEYAVIRAPQGGRRNAASTRNSKG